MRLVCQKCLAVVEADDPAVAERRYGNHLGSHLDGREIREAANELADARVRFAREFSRLKLANPTMTDKAAIYAATEATNDEVTRLEAELEIEKRRT